MIDAMDLVRRHFHPVLPASKLGKTPVQVQIAGTSFALFRDASGRAAALLDRCPHRFAPLSKGHVRPDGRLACAYHGWNFDAQGHGRSPSQPTLAKCDVASFQVVERHGYLWLSARGTSPSLVPDLGWEDFELSGAFATRFEAPLHVAFDNFSEDEHTPWVHNFLGWTESGAAELDFEAKNFDDRTEVRYTGKQRPSVWARFLLLKPGDVFHNEWVTTFSPVCSIYTMHWTSPSGERRPVTAKIPIFFVPETETTCSLHTFVFSRLDDPRFRPLLPIIRRIAMLVAYNEVMDDARFVPNVASTPFEMKGMRLGKYDKPLVHNHRLLRSLYYGEKVDPASRDTATWIGDPTAPAGDPPWLPQ
ncbi:MAG: Rieske (2Fe-2S) region [Myxococcaceae bacterium]|nr:Rieske (2Fe-2S) region [Myxococcaceae bacterium]